MENFILYLETPTPQFIIFCLSLFALVFISLFRFRKIKPKTETEISDEHLLEQINLWRDGIERLTAAEKVDKAIGDRDFSTSKGEIVSIVSEYTIIKK